MSTAELHLSGLIGKASHTDMKKIGIMGFFFESRLHWQFEVRLLLFTVCTYLGTAVVEWLRCCATNRKVACSIPDGVIGIFLRHIPSERTMAPGSTQPLTEVSTRRISWG